MTFPISSLLAGAAVLLATSSTAIAGPVWSSANCVMGNTAQQATQCVSTGAAQSHTAKLTGWAAPAAGVFAATSLVRYGEGLGMNSGTDSGSPYHAIDNNGTTEGLLMQFGSDFALKQLSSGWVYGDADVSVLRYTGATAPVMGASRVNNLLAVPGWELVGNFSSLTPTTPLSFNQSGLAASWWFVSAYNMDYTGNNAGANFGNGNDYFKLQGFGGDFAPVKPPAPPAKVSEPATLGLLSIAMLGLVAGRRKSKAA